MAKLSDNDYPGYPEYPSDPAGFAAWLDAERAFWARLDAAEAALSDDQIVGVQVPMTVGDACVTYVVTRARPLTLARVPSGAEGDHPDYVAHVKREHVLAARRRNAFMRGSGGTMPRRQPLIWMPRSR